MKNALRNPRTALRRFLRSSEMLNNCMRRTLEHRVPLDSGNKCVKCREIFAEESSVKIILKNKECAWQDINDY